MEEALGHYRRARPALRAAGDTVTEAKAVSAMGQVYYDHGHYDTATALHAEALALLDRADDPPTRAYALIGLGLVCKAQGRYKEALRHFDAARQVAEGAGDEDQFAQALTNMGLVHHRQGRAAEALEHCERALAVQVGIGDAAGQARTLGVLGDLHHEQGRTDLALEHYHRALSMLVDTDDPPSRANILGSIGLAHHERGRYDDALEHYEQTLAIHERFGDRSGRATTHNNIGLLHEAQGRYREALDHLGRALSIQRDLQEEGPGEATILNNVAGVYHAQGHHELALEHYHRALRIVGRTGERASEARTHSNIGAVLGDLNRPEEAVEHFTRALRILEEVGDPAARAAALHNLGMAHFRARRREQAIVYAQRALSVCVDIGARASEVGVRAMLARMYWARLQSGSGDDPVAARDAARRQFEEAVRIVEELRETMLTRDSRAWFFSSNSEIYRTYADFLVYLGEHEAAFEMAQRGKARAFLDTLGGGQGGSADQEELWAALAAASDLMDTTESETERESAAGRIARLERSLRALERDDRRQRDDHGLATGSGTVTVEEVRERLLPEDGALLEYVCSGSATLVFCVTESDFAVFPLTTSSGEIDRMVRELHTAVSRRLPAYPHGHALYRAVIGPAEALLQGKTDLLICADGALCYLPFALLLSGDPDGRPSWGELPYLINGVGGRDLAVTLRYSSTAHVAAHFQERAGERRSRLPEHRSELVALAYPAAVESARGRFDQIDETVEETWEIAALLAKDPDDLPPPDRRPDEYHGHGVSVLTNSAATKSDLLEHAARPHGVLHLATHGYLDPYRPELSGLFLAGRADASDSWPAYEIASDAIDCDLVTLSCCDTALGPSPKGEGVVSLTRSFQQAGAEAVCATLWQIHDRPTRELMRAFYTQIVGGVRPAEALVRAQHAFKHEHPAHWAAHTFWQ